MSDKQITVDVAPDGSLSIDASGFSGSDCEEATQFLEEKLGTIDKHKRKPEYYKQATRQHTNMLRR